MVVNGTVDVGSVVIVYAGQTQNGLESIKHQRCVTTAANISSAAAGSDGILLFPQPLLTNPSQTPLMDLKNLQFF